MQVSHCRLSGGFRSRWLLLLGATLGAALPAVPDRGDDEVYPVIPVAFTEAGPRPVFGGYGMSARVVLDRGTSLAPVGTPILFVRDHKFSPGRVEVRLPDTAEAKARGQLADLTLARGDVREITVELVPTGVPVPAYALCVLYSDESYALSFFSLGQLTDGKAIPISFQFPYNSSSTLKNFLVCVYTPQGEVRTNLRESIAPALRQFDRNAFGLIREDYIRSNAGKAVEPQAFSTPLPIFPEDLGDAEIDETVSVEVLVNVNGYAEDVKVVGEARPSLAEEAVRTLRTWRFLPALKAGVPSAQMVRIPLRFNSKPAAPKAPEGAGPAAP